MPLVFSYGSLQLDSVQVSTFGRSLHGQPDELVGYERTLVSIGDPEVVRRLGRAENANVVFNGRADSRVRGMVFEITDAELAAADDYERRDQYQRVSVTLASNRQAWVYTFASTDPAVSG